MRDIREAVNARRGQRQQPGRQDVQRDLDDVEQVQQHRGTEADLGPVPGHRDDLLSAGALAPLLEVDLRSFLFEKSHGGKIRTCSSPMVAVRRITAYP